MKKPKIEVFTEVCTKARGNKTRIAEALGVSRVIVHNWINNDPRFKKAVEDQQGRLFDRLLQTAESVALGVPKLDKDGKRIGWKEAPDTKMLTYLIGHLGVKEGFGDRLDITTNGESIKPEHTVIEIIDKREQVQSPNDEEEDS